MPGAAGRRTASGPGGAGSGGAGGRDGGAAGGNGRAVGSTAPGRGGAVGGAAGRPAAGAGTITGPTDGVGMNGVLPSGSAVPPTVADPALIAARIGIEAVPASSATVKR